MVVPSRRPNAILTVVSSIRRPTDKIGRAGNQAPEPLSLVTRSLACSTSFLAPSRRDEAVLAVMTPSQFVSLQAPELVGTGALWPCDHIVRVISEDRGGRAGPADQAAAGPIFWMVGGRALHGLEHVGHCTVGSLTTCMGTVIILSTIAQALYRKYTCRNWLIYMQACTVQPLNSKITRTHRRHKCDTPQG